MTTHAYYHSKQKRFFDLILACLLLFFLLPVLILICLLIFLTDSTPIIFRQMRVGKNKQVFTLYKFRTMKNGSSLFQKKLKGLNEAPYPMFKIKNDPRFTRIGILLSHLGLDELPQILNIIKGEMSFVGPRPLPVKESQQLDSTWDFRYKIKPGIISKWALSPHRYASLESWKQLEKDQLQHGSIFEDVKLISIAINKVTFKRSLLTK